MAVKLGDQTQPPENDNKTEEKSGEPKHNPFEDLICYYCGERGHIKPNCPHREGTAQVGQYANVVAPIDSQGGVFVKAKVNGLQTKTLMDTGASTSLMSPRIEIDITQACQRPPDVVYEIRMSEVSDVTEVVIAMIEVVEDSLTETEGAAMKHAGGQGETIEDTGWEIASNQGDGKKGENPQPLRCAGDESGVEKGSQPDWNLGENIDGGMFDRAGLGDEVNVSTAVKLVGDCTIEPLHEALLPISVENPLYGLTEI